MKKPNSKQQPATLSPSAAANQALIPAFEYAATGGKHSSIADAMTRLTGQPVNRQMVGRWLNTDPEKREQPRLGYGLTLLWAVAVCKLVDKGVGIDRAIEYPGGLKMEIDLNRPKAIKENKPVPAKPKPAPKPEPPMRAGIITGDGKGKALPRLTGPTAGGVRFDKKTGKATKPAVVKVSPHMRRKMEAAQRGARRK